jgi:phosphatidate cytidylyltransferase
MGERDVSDAAAKKSDLGVRTGSAVVMLAVTGTALWLGGWWWTALVALVAAGVLYEWQKLARQFASGAAAQALWSLAGILYLGLAAAMLMFLRDGDAGLTSVLAVGLMVIATDIGAYFAGRTIGGPKIAPTISPSKTWAGLCGGMAASGVVMALLAVELSPEGIEGKVLLAYALGGALVAVVAQAGDFFESWMKRRAGVKDSSHLIPGHGGLFDRVDGLLAVSFVLGVLFIVGRVVAPA